MLQLISPGGYKKDLVLYFSSCTFHFILGFVLGKQLDRFNAFISNRFKLTALSATALHLFLMISVFFVIEIYISPMFVQGWQKTTPGFIFAFTFFTSQKHLNHNLESLL